jgi:hypothetical protein
LQLLRFRQHAGLSLRQYRPNDRQVITISNEPANLADQFFRIRLDVVQQAKALTVQSIQSRAKE